MPGLLVLVKQIMHLPKLSLQPGSFCRARRRERMHMRGNERKLAENYANARAEFLFHRFQNRMKHATRRAFKVAKLFQRNRRVFRPLSVRRNGAGFSSRSFAAGYSSVACCW